MLALLTLLAAARAAEVPTGGAAITADWGRSWRWSLGLRGGLVAPMLQSGRSWSAAADGGVVAELALGDGGLSWVSYLDRSRHSLRDGGDYLVDLPAEAGSALDGTATHRWIQTGLRWQPVLPASPGLRVAPVIGALVGTDIHTTDLELPVPGGRERVRSVGYQPSVAPTFGVNFEVLPELHLLAGTAYGLLFAFDQAEVSGPDRLGMSARLLTTLEVLGRF